MARELFSEVDVSAKAAGQVLVPVHAQIQPVQMLKIWKNREQGKGKEAEQCDLLRIGNG